MGVNDAKKGFFRENLKKIQMFFCVKKKIALFSLAIVPITSVGAGMTITVDNTAVVAPEPIFANDTVINLDENIIVNFAEPIVDTAQYEKNIGVYPREQLLFLWGNDGGRLTIVPRSIWKPETEYSLAFPHDVYGENTELSTIFSFETVSYPEIMSTNMEKEDQYIAEGESIVVRFDREVEKFDMQAVVRPYIAKEQIYDPERNELHITLKERSRSVNGFHTMTIFAKHKRQQNAGFYPLGAISFTVFLPQPEMWPEEHQERLDIAEKSTIPQITEGRYIDVNLEAQITTLFENGDFVSSFVNSAGAEDTPTPTGRFEIYNKDPYALSEMFQVYLPFWMAFTEDGEYGFHDLIVWPEGHEERPGGGKESEASIGNAVSPGCVRHDAENSKFIYEWADVGIPVVIY